MKKTLIASAIATLAVVPATQAAVKISGQLNQAVILDSDLDDIEVVDNNHSGSRFRFRADKEFGGLKTGLRYELQAQSNNSTSGEDGLIQEVRYSDVWLSGDFGKISIGRGNSASEGSFESHGVLGHYLAQDLTWLAVNSSLNEENRIAYRSIDGFSRANRVRYDSPNFSGFKFAVAQLNSGITDFGVSYNGKIGGGKLRFRAGVADGDTPTDDRTSLSAAYQTSFGLGVGYSYAENDDDFDTDWATVSWNFGGKYVLSFGTGEDSNNNDQTVVGLNYKPIKGVEIYLNTVTADNASGTEADATYLGSRVKF